MSNVKSHLTKAFSLSMKAQRGHAKEVAGELAACSPIEAALIIAQMHREVDIKTMKAVEDELLAVA